MNLIWFVLVLSLLGASSQQSTSIVSMQQFETHFDLRELGVRVLLTWSDMKIKIVIKKDLWLTFMEVATAVVDLRNSNIDLKIFLAGCYKYHIDANFQTLIMSLLEPDNTIQASATNRYLRLKKGYAKIIKVDLRVTIDQRGKINSISVNGLIVTTDYLGGSIESQLCEGRRETITLNQMAKMLSKGAITEL